VGYLVAMEKKEFELMGKVSPEDLEEVEDAVTDITSEDYVPDLD